MDILIDEASERAVLEAFHRSTAAAQGEPLPLKDLHAGWPQTGLRLEDLTTAVKRLIDVRLIERSIGPAGVQLALTLAGQREVEESFGRGRCRGEDWIAEITLLAVRQRNGSGAASAIDRRVA